MSEIFPACDPKVRDGLRKKHWPKGMGFLPDHDALLSRGWPHLAVLVDADPRDKKPAELALKVLGAIDPLLTVYWPRAASVAFLNAFATPAGMAPITVALADKILVNACETLDHYPFHWRSACFLLEAHLGAEAMADRVLCLLETMKKSVWRFSNLHHRLLDVLFALELFILRSSPKAAATFCSRLRALYGKRPKDTNLPIVAWRIAITLEGAAAYERHKDAFVYNVPFLTHEDAFIPRYLEHEYSTWLLDPQLLAIAGPSIAKPKTIAGMRRDASWKQVERTVVFGIIRHPVIVEIFATMAGSKSAKGKPEQWLAEHLEYARPVLQRLISKSSPQAAVLKQLVAAGPSAVRVAAKQAKSPRRLTSKQLDVGVEKIFKNVVSAIKKVRGKQSAEASLWKHAAIAVMELRSAAGDPCPEERLGHAFGIDGWGKADPPFQTLNATHAEIDRWIDVINTSR